MSRVFKYFKTLNHLLLKHLTIKELGSVVSIFLFFLMQKLCLMHGFQTHFWDQYFFDNGLYNISNGRGWFMNHAFNNAHFFTQHFQPIYYLIAPLYLILATPIWIFIIHSFCLTFSLIPLIKYAKYRCPSINNIGLKTLFICCFIYLPFRSGNLTDLHAEVLILPLFSWIAYFLLTRRYQFAIFLSLLLPLFKENMIVYYFGMAVFLIVNKQFKRAALIFLYGFICTVLVVKLIMPMFGLADYYHLNRFSYLNPTSITDVFKQMILNPHLVIQHLLSKKVVDYLLGIFGLLLFFPLFSSVTLIASGLILQNALADQWAMLLFTSHYTLPMVPILLMASVNTYSRCRSKPKILKLVQFFVLFFLILNLLYFTIFEFRSFVIPKSLRDVHKHIDTIPKEKSVCSTSYFSSHFLYHREISEFPSCNGEDILFLEKLNPYFPVNESTESFAKREWDTGDRRALIWNLIIGERISDRVTYQRKLDDVKSFDNYELVGEGERFIIYRKKVSHF